MKQRCYNPNSSQYRYYGGRGIKVCDRWLESFENFYEDMGDCPEGMSIDRKDSEGDYEPRNCRWATKEEQANNTRSNKWFSYENELKTLSQLGRILNIKRLTLWRRLNAYGWSEERAFSTPARVTNRT
jgi:hypothetical protein